MDCLIVDEFGYILGRPLICAAIDVYSRTIIGWHICMLAPCATKTLLTLKDMFTRPINNLPGGIPSMIIPDNGVEFRNYSVERLCQNLNITLVHSKPGKPNNKPHIERFFETFDTTFIHKLPGTTFSNPLKRDGYDSSKLACLTLEDLRELTHEWIENIYHLSIHASLQQRPINVWKNSIEICPPMHLTKYDADIVCRTVHRAKINQGRISFLGLHYYSHALKTLENNFRDKVSYYVDETDLSIIYVQDPFDKYNFIIADSTNPQLTKNLTLIELVESRKILREEYKISPEHQKQEKYLHLARLRLIEKVQELSKVKRKLRQVKNDLPEMIRELEYALNINKESSANTKNTSKNFSSSNFIDEINTSTNSDYDFFVEEINLDD
jgi:putative transposase